MEADLPSRVEALEAAVVALGATEFGDTAGHAFHGNQWTDAGGSPSYDLVIGPHPYQAGKVQVRLDKKGDPQGKNWDSRTVNPGEEAKGVADLARSYNPAQEAERAKRAAEDRERNTSRTPEQVQSELDMVNEELREQGGGYSATSLPSDRIRGALKESEDPDGDGTGTVKPPSGYEISITNSTLKAMLRGSR